MSRSSLLKRYAPLLGIVAVQLILVAIAPSTGPGGAAAPAPLPVVGTVDPNGGQTTPGITPSGAPTALGGTPSAGAHGPGGTGQGHGTATPGGTATEAGDISRCAKGGVLQQTVTNQSIPCRPKLPGSNGGATYRGVTANSITVVLYQAKVNAVTNSILAGVGAADDPAKGKDAMAAFGSFFAKHYEFQGRSIIWKTFQGSCQIDPPDDACLRSDARTLVSTLKPFWVIWPSGRPSFYQELSSLGVLNSGGLSFGGAWSRAQRPYHWMAFMDGDRIANNVADYWCKKLNGKNATLAGDPKLRTQKRKLGILVRQEPANRESAQLLARLVSGVRCKGPVPPIITYTQDIAQAQLQAAAGVAALKKDGVTTVVSLGSVLEISLQASGFDRGDYYPENLMSGTGLEDQDAAGRLIAADQWSHAFGPGDLINARPRAQDDDTLAWRSAGRSGVPYTQGSVLFQEMQQVVWQLQLASPDLTPLNVEHASLTMPVVGGWAQTHNPFAQRYQFSAQGYSGPSDSRQVYWNPNAISKADGKKGAYVAVDGGRRYPVGEWPAGSPKK